MLLRGVGEAIKFGCMKILLATPFLSTHFDAGWFWVSALSQLGLTCCLWDYRRQPMPKVEVDFTLVMKGESIDPRSLPRPRVCYWPDAIERTPGIEQLLQLYDKVYTPVRPTPAGMIWMPSGFDPDIHRYTGVPRDLDSLYIGTNNSDRKRRFLAVIKPSVIAGNGWEGISEPGTTFLPPQYLHDFVALASRAQVLINIHQGPVGVNRKLMECCACSPCLTDDVPGVSEIFGESLAKSVSFSTPKKGAEMLSYYLSHPKDLNDLWGEELLKIKPHSYLNLSKTMIDIVH